MREGWVQLAPYGDFPNTDQRGRPVIQRFTKADAEAMANDFKALGELAAAAARVALVCGASGSSALSRPAGAYRYGGEGSHQGSEAREDGLYAPGEIQQRGTAVDRGRGVSRALGELARVPAGAEGGKTIFSPRGLKSVGFTNQPQIPVTPVASAAIGARMANEKAPFSVTLDEQGG